VQARAVIVNIRDDHQLVCPCLGHNAASPSRTVSVPPTMERANICIACAFSAVNKRPRFTPPSLGRSIAWLADRRRDPTPIDSCEAAAGSRVSTPAGRVRQLTAGLANDPARQHAGCRAAARSSAASRNYMRYAEEFHPAALVMRVRKPNRSTR
jgi:hypothetical protein